MPHNPSLHRRDFLHAGPIGLGAIALSQLLQRDLPAAESNPLLPHPPQSAPKIKNVIFLFMAGGPSQLDLFEDKPVLRTYDGQPPPDSLIAGRRFAFLKPDAKLLGSRQKFMKYGECGMELSELLPYHRQIVDDVCWLRGVKTDVFNHGPAKLFLNCGFQAPGRPSLGSWVTYGLGSPSSDLPGFVVLQSGPRGPRAGNTLWSSGFLPTSYQGVPLRGQGAPILDLDNPVGVTPEDQREFVNAVADLNRLRMQTVADPEIATRINAYETAFRMQTSAPELMRLQDETAETLDLYGAKPGGSSFANNCLLARRLVERGVRFVQLYHTDWDHHGGNGADLEEALAKVCKDVDQAAAALVLDLKRRGLLDETLVVWSGEFGRTPMGEQRGTLGRDHHIDSFTLWMAGGGLKAGHLHGETDELGFGVTAGQVHVHDLHATILHLLGFNHEQLTYRFQGRDFRLTDVHGKVVHDILA
ncbi:DUF1501 domain-containing protein [Planctellipticum variicoloris]|uniref:DUF1501 domain-containing protein n=1 Tax=Planctellipticum variicoloris TaxID=3064265 RepID=UPI00301350E0|nr:DUF1501 domain-containing protein [Planctomycetaceae bacterium SH412]